MDIKQPLIVCFIGLTLAIAMSPVRAIAMRSCFIALDNKRIIAQRGDCVARHSPCSTFKIALSAMAFNDGILIDEAHPVLPFKAGYVDWFPTWKEPHNPLSWIRDSCIWYSQVLTQRMGMRRIKYYLNLFHYGNQDFSGDSRKDNGLTNAWLSSSLSISPVEQVHFIDKLVRGLLPVSQNSQDMTRRLLRQPRYFTNGWSLFGKTGSGYQIKRDGVGHLDRPIGWFVGWIEHDNHHIVFAEYIEASRAMQDSPGLVAKRLAEKNLLSLLVDTKNSPGIIQ